MFWSDLFYIIVITTFTGSILTVAWLITSYLLDKTGYLNISYRFSKVVVPFWIIPVMYFIVSLSDRLMFKWNGHAFDTSPVIINITRIIVGVWIVGLAAGIVIYVFKRLKIMLVMKEAFVCDKDMNKVFCVQP